MPINKIAFVWTAVCLSLLDLLLVLRCLEGRCCYHYILCRIISVFSKVAEYYFCLSAAQCGDKYFYSIS